MVYEEFVQFISQLYRLAGEEIPALSITRDLFNFIDVKKDGVIDINEWNQTFNNLTVILTSFEALFNFNIRHSIVKKPLLIQRSKLSVFQRHWWNLTKLIGLTLRTMKKL